MPVIFVWNAFGLRFDPRHRWRSAQSTTPSAVKEGPSQTVWVNALQHDFSAALRNAVLSVKELGQMAPADILIVFPEAQTSPADLTLISVDVLFAAEHRTREVREKLAERLKAAAEKLYAAQGETGVYRVEVAIKRFDAQADVYI